MKLLSYLDNDEVKPGICDGETVYDISSVSASISNLLDTYGTDLQVIEKAHAAGDLTEVGSVNSVLFKPPVYYPRKLLCVAGNYVAHIEEGGGKLQPEHTQAPWLFCVPPTSVMIGHGEKIQLLPQAQKIDYEGELAVVIGRKAKSVAAKDAADYIVGYTIYNDVSERTPFMIEHVEEKQQLSFWYTKSFDTFGPNGPFITTSDEIADPQDLTIRVNVNGEERQNCSTNQMIFSVYELVEFLTSFLTLEPGDVIATGTPAGVGSATGFFLKGGDTVQISIDGLGTLGNSVVQT
ncbi:MAG: fumarylacetoacetate hydrolase family protein [Candidatus Poribacteria bacterium]|nr:fumarylacetoacetate hydrolase family protein [Candidatus Poribacteria bacterium]